MKTNNKSANFKIPKPFCFLLRICIYERNFIETHCVEIRFVIETENVLFVRVCFNFQPGNCTGWGSEGVVNTRTQNHFFVAGWCVSALPPPNYEDAILFPVSSSSCGDILGEAATATAVHAHKDVLPSYDTACASADRFQLTVSPASSPRKADGGVSRSLGERVSSSTPPSVSESSFTSPATAVCTAPRVPPSSSSYSSASANGAGYGGCHQSLVGDLGRGTGHVHDVAILVTRSQETAERQTSGPTSSLLCAGDSAACGSAASSQRTRDSQCSSARSSQRSCIVTDIDVAAQTMNETCSASVRGPRPVSAADSEGIGSGAFCYRAGQDTLPRPRSDDLGRRTSDGWQRAQPTTGKRASRDLTLSGLGPRTQRSCSDAVVHAASRTRAAAAAAAATGRSSNLMCAYPHSHQHPHQNGGEQSRACSHQHHHQYQCHRSHSCISQHLEVADNSGIPK